MSIIIKITSQFQGELPGLWPILRDKWNPSIDIDKDIVPLVQEFLHHLVDSIQMRWQNNWNDFEPLGHSVSLNMTDQEFFKPFHMQCLKVHSQLLYESQCRRAIESIQNEKDAVESLPQNLDSSIDKQKGGFVVPVGALISALLLIQIFL